MPISKLLKNRCFLFILVLGIFEPKCISDLAFYEGGYWSTLHTFFQAMSIFSIVIILVFFLCLLRRVSSKSFSIIVVLFEFWLLFSNIMNGINIRYETIYAFQIISIAILTELTILYQYEDKLISVCTAILGIFIILNFITIVFYPNGLYINDWDWSQNFFLGYRTLHIYVYFPYFLMLALKDFKEKGTLKVRYYIMLLVALVSSVLTSSTTSMLGLTVLTVLLILGKNMKKITKPLALGGYIASALISIGLIFFSIQSQFSAFLVDILGKDATFTHRTLIWEAALLDIIKNPIIGNGATDVNIRLYFDVQQCHNKFLDIVFIGGVIALALFSAIIIKSCLKLCKSDNVFLSNVLSFVLCGYFVLFLMESRRTDVYMFIVLTFCYYIDRIKIKVPPRKRIRI